jgi:transcriptional regulator with XRE-family HTH domain
MDFADWLQQEIDRRGLNANKLAKASGRKANTIQNILHRERSVGPEVARDLARAFGLPQAVVFRAAGLMTEAVPLEGDDPQVVKIYNMIRDWDEKRLDTLLAIIAVVEAQAGQGGDDPNTRGRHLAPAGNSNQLSLVG